jgi:hypothetical protein
MILPILELYQILEQNKDKFESENLLGNFFIDLFRNQPLDPELHEYYSLPAIFIDYNITGQGKDKPRAIELTLHIVLEESFDASNVSENYTLGLNRFVYMGILQEILEGKKLANGSPLRFINETMIDSPVCDYHKMVFAFETYAPELIRSNTLELGEFEQLNFTGKLKQKKEAV